MKLQIVSKDGEFGIRKKFLCFWFYWCKVYRCFQPDKTFPFSSLDEAERKIQDWQSSIANNSSKIAVIANIYI